MKTFLIVAGLLMTGASVYGVVDYNAKAKNPEFKELYKEKPVPVEIEVVEEIVPAPVPIFEKKEAAKKEVLTDGNVEPVKKAVIKKKVVKKKKSEDRKLRLKEFSRGKMRE